MTEDLTTRDINYLDGTEGYLGGHPIPSESIRKRAQLGTALARALGQEAMPLSLGFTLPDSITGAFGDGSDITMQWNGTKFLIGQATANSAIDLGVSGAGIDLVLYGDTVGRNATWDQSADSLIFGDSAKVVFGTGSDITILWDGTDLLVSQALANSAIKWGVSGAGIKHVFYGDTATLDMTWDQANDQLLFADNAFLGIGTGAGAAADIRMSWNGTKMLVAQLTVNSAIDWGVSGAGIDMVFYGDTVGANCTWDQSADSLIFGDGAKIGFGTPGTDVAFTADGTDLVVTATGDFVFADAVDLKIGTGKDLGLRHDGTNSYIENTTGILRIDNQHATSNVQIDQGSDTSATAVVFRNNSGITLFQVDGAGLIKAGVDMWADCPSEASASVTTHAFFDDFTRATFSASEWVVTEDDAADTQLVNDALGGTVTLTCKATTDDDANQIQWKQESFRLTSGKKLWVEFMIKSASGDMVNSDWFVGLIETEDLTGVADNMPANGIGFHKEDGAATFSASSSDNGTNLQSAAVGTIVNATYIRVGLKFDGGATGAATITPYINGVAGTPIASVTYATMAEVSAAFMVRNGDATTTQTLVVDYVKVVQER